MIQALGRRARLLPLAALLALGPVPPAPAAPAPAPAEIDRILAVVNDDVVTETELRARLETTKKQLVIEKIKAPTDDVLRKQLLEQLVLERLQLQLAQQTGIRVSETEINQAIESIARRNKMDVEGFQKMLQREGLDSQTYRAEIRNQLTIRNLLEREINNRVTVTEAEVDGFLENEEGRASVNLAYDLSHIFIAIPESASPETIARTKGRAEEVHRLLRQGGDFAQAAVSHSQGPEAMQGGHVGWKKAGQLPELFLGALKNLPVGAVSDILRSPNGFHILRLNDKRGDTQTESVTQTRVRHILLKPSEIQSLEEARTKLALLRERVENGEDFAALARTHSEDPGSAANGGDLGWINPGQLVPDFEKAMNALKPAGLSQPVRTPFGYHLIQVLERRVHDISQEKLRAAARSQIHARKADERYEQWVRQLRDEAYVEYVEVE